MSEQIRFHLDEHIDSNIARGLRRYGIDVTTTVDAGLRTKSDESHLEFIREWSLSATLKLQHCSVSIVLCPTCRRKIHGN